MALTHPQLSVNQATWHKIRAGNILCACSEEMWSKCGGLCVCKKCSENSRKVHYYGLYASYLVLSLSSDKGFLELHVISTGGKQENYSSVSHCHCNWTRSTFILQGHTPDGCFDCLNHVGRWVSSGRWENETSLEQATAGRALFPHMERSTREMAAPLGQGWRFPFGSSV